MKQIVGYYFPECWADINPRFAWADKEVNLQLGIFTELDAARAQTINSDCNPEQIQDFMVKVSVTLSYCSVLVARLGGHFNQAEDNYSLDSAKKRSSDYAGSKSDAALERNLKLDPDLINKKGDRNDLETMKEYATNIFRTLQKDAENWRARYYGAGQDRKLTPSVEAPDDSVLRDGRIPPSLGG